MADGCFLRSDTFGTFITSFLLVLLVLLGIDRSPINTSNFILAPIPGPFRPPGASQTCWDVGERACYYRPVARGR